MGSGEAFCEASQVGVNVGRLSIFSSQGAATKGATAMRMKKVSGYETSDTKTSNSPPSS